MKQKLIDYYMDVAERTAQLSYATRLQVGAIAVKNGQIISEGCNGTPPGWYTNICEDENNITLPETYHAEQNLLAKLCQSTISSKDCDVFVTHSPCINCSKILASAGVRTVYYKNEYRLTDGINFLRKCGVEVIQVGGNTQLEANKKRIINTIPDCTILSSNNPNILTVQDEDGQLDFMFNEDNVYFIQNSITLTVDNMVKYLTLPEQYQFETIENDDDMVRINNLIKEI